MTEAQCENCGHDWNYTGEKTPPSKISCPNCLSRMPVPEGHDPTEEA